MPRALVMQTVARQGCVYASSSSRGGGGWPKIMSQDRSSKLGFMVSGRPQFSLKNCWVEVLHRLVHAVTQVLASRNLRAEWGAGVAVGVRQAGVPGEWGARWVGEGLDPAYYREDYLTPYQLLRMEAVCVCVCMWV